MKRVDLTADDINADYLLADLFSKIVLYSEQKKTIIVEVEVS